MAVTNAKRMKAPWYIVRTDDKRRGRLNLITHLLGQVPYEPLGPRRVTLSQRDDADADEPVAAAAVGRQHIPTPF
jgi:hypothetical protein